MARSLSYLGPEGLTAETWLTEDGWPYEDADAAGELDLCDHGADLDDDLVSLHATGTHLFDGLEPIERTVLAARLGLDGGAPRSMRELEASLGITRSQLRHAYGDAIAKVRLRLL